MSVGALYSARPVAKVNLNSGASNASVCSGVGPDTALCGESECASVVGGSVDKTAPLGAGKLCEDTCCVSEAGAYRPNAELIDESECS